MWLFYSLLAAIFWGVGQVIIKKGFKHLPPLFNNVLAATILFAIIMPLSLTHGVHFENIISILPLTIVVAIIFLIYYYVINLGQVSLTGTIISISPLITVILSIIFLHESLNIFQKMAIGLILSGVVCLALPEKIYELKKNKIGNWFLWALLTAVFIGFADFLIKLLITQSDVYTYLFTYSFCVVFVSAISIFFDRKGRKLPIFSFKSYLPTIAGVIFMEIGFLSFHFAISEGFVSLVAPISAIYVAITAVLAWMLLKEKINKIQFAGIALATIGVILIGIV